MSSQTHLQQQMRRLLRCMDFVSKHPALNKPGREGTIASALSGS